MSPFGLLLFLLYKISTKTTNIKLGEIRYWKYIKIESNHVLKNDIKNRTCYYFNNIIKIEDFYFNNILIEEKLNENILVYNISYKTLIGENPLRIRLDKVHGFISVCDRARCLVLFDLEKSKNLFSTGLGIL